MKWMGGLLEQDDPRGPEGGGGPDDRAHVGRILKRDEDGAPRGPVPVHPAARFGDARQKQGPAGAEKVQTTEEVRFEAKKRQVPRPGRQGIVGVGRQQRLAQAGEIP